MPLHIPYQTLRISVGKENEARPAHTRDNNALQLSSSSTATQSRRLLPLTSSLVCRHSCWFSRPIFNVAINTLYFPLIVLLLIYKSEYFTFLNQDQSFPSIFTSGSEATVTQRLVIAGFQAWESQFSGRVENGTNTRTEMMTKRTVPERFQTLGSSYSWGRAES